MHCKVEFHAQKSRILPEASSRIPNFSYGLCSIIRAEAVSKNSGKFLVKCFSNNLIDLKNTTNFPFFLSEFARFFSSVVS